MNIFINNLPILNLPFLINLVVGLCILSIFLAVALNFLNDSEQKRKLSKQEKSIVETGTMTGFFVLVYVLLRFRIGSLEVSHWGLVLAGLTVMIFGTFFNIWGRKYLGKNWLSKSRFIKHIN